MDTNIFIAQLRQLQNLFPESEQFLSLSRNLSSPPHPISVSESEKRNLILYVPWSVFQELDKLKSRDGNEALKKKAIKAIQYLHCMLSGNNPRVS